MAEYVLSPLSLKCLTAIERGFDYLQESLELEGQEHCFESLVRQVTERALEPLEDRVYQIVRVGTDGTKAH